MNGLVDYVQYSVIADEKLRCVDGKLSNVDGKLWGGDGTLSNVDGKLWGLMVNCGTLMARFSRLMDSWET
jgi:hypothetical protein